MEQGKPTLRTECASEDAIISKTHNLTNVIDGPLVNCEGHTLSSLQQPHRQIHSTKQEHTDASIYAKECKTQKSAIYGYIFSNLPFKSGPCINRMWTNWCIPKVNVIRKSS